MIEFVNKTAQLDMSANNKDLEVKALFPYSLDETLTKDNYAADAKAVGDAIDSLEERMKTFKVDDNSNMRTLGKCALWYRDYTAWGNNIEECARALARFDLIVGGGTLHSVGGTSEEQTQIILRARELNPNIKFFFYFSIASWRSDNGYAHILKPGGVWDEEEAAEHEGIVRIYNKWEHFQLTERALHMGGHKTDKKELVEKDFTWTDEDGVTHTEDKYIYLYEGGIPFDGVFYDDAGMDSTEGVINQGYKNMRDKSICLCDFAHERGLSCFVNQLNADNWYSEEVSTANPDGLRSAVDERDFLLVESCHTQHGDSSGYPLWRHLNGAKGVYNYYKNYYPTVGAKVVVNDYPVSSLSKDEYNKLLTFCVFDCIATGAHYLDFNGSLTWELPEVAKYFEISNDEELKNKWVEDGIYTLEANNHTLTVTRPTSITQGLKCNENTLDRIQINIDGNIFNNAYIEAPELEGALGERIEVIEETLEDMQTSEKKTSSVFHRMLIDDWGKEYNYTNLIDDTWWEQLITTFSKYATINSYDTELMSLDCVRTSSTQVTKSLVIDVENIKGHTLEIGMSVINNTSYACGVSVGSRWVSLNSNNGNASTLYPDVDTYTFTYTIPEDYKNETLSVKLVFNGSTGNVFNFTHYYVIDKDEFIDDIHKEWYTNGVPLTKNYSNFNNIQNAFTFEETGDYSFNITWDGDGYKTWAGVKYTIPENTFKIGHQYELGCELFETNLSNNNIAFRLQVPASPSGKEYWYPKSEKMISEIYGESRQCMLVNIPDDIVLTTGGGTLYLSNISSSNLNSDGEYASATIKNLYIYDIDEEDIVFRGSTPSNSYLQICRVTEEKLATDNNLIVDALYITDKGNMFITDFNGEKINLVNTYVGQVLISTQENPLNIYELEGTWQELATTTVNDKNIVYWQRIA